MQPLYLIGFKLQKELSSLKRALNFFYYSDERPELKKQDVSKNISEARKWLEPWKKQFDESIIRTKYLLGGRLTGQNPPKRPDLDQLKLHDIEIFGTKFGRIIDDTVAVWLHPWYQYIIGKAYKKVKPLSVRNLHSVSFAYS